MTAADISSTCTRELHDLAIQNVPSQRLVCNVTRMKPSIERARSPFDYLEDDSSDHRIVSKQDASLLVGLSLEEAARLLLSWVEKP